jgi:tRNA (guanine26-N2/guanine27-N2)-dimethyltransferase
MVLSLTSLGISSTLRYSKLSSTAYFQRPFQRSLIDNHSFFPYQRRRVTFPAENSTQRAAAMSFEPSSDSVVQVDGKEYEAVNEGLAYILKPVTASGESLKSHTKSNGQGASVFYNPIQQFNRDLSVLAIKAHSEHVLALRKRAAERRQERAAHKATNGNSKKRKRDDEGQEGQREKSPPENNGVNEDVAVADASPSAPVEQSETVPTGPKSSPFQILDALSATGLRALRYAKEIPFATRIVSNDLSPSAIDSIKVNIRYNGLEHIIQPNLGDARFYMYSLLGKQKTDSNGVNVGKFDVIDLDPYGTAAPFLDAAVQGINDGGLLCVTCTDAGVFASAGYPEKTFSLYGGLPVRGAHNHEAALRLIINAIATSAARYGLSVEPLLSLSIDYYVRLFVRVYRSPAEVKYLSDNTMILYNCDSGCGAWTTQPLSNTKTKVGKNEQVFHNHVIAQAPVASRHCDHCGSKTHLGGPMWAGPLHNPHFVHRILNMLPSLDRGVYKTVDRIEGMLTTALEEDLKLGESSKDTTEETTTTNDTDKHNHNNTSFSSTLSPIIPRIDPALKEPHPFFVSLSALSKVLHSGTIPMHAFRGALYHLGYKSARSHTKPNSVRTDAPWDVIWEIMREWVRQKSPIKDGALTPGSAGWTIMQKARTNVEGGGEMLSALQEELKEALESGKDVHDLTTKIEAALYRRGARSTLRSKSNKHSNRDDQPPVGEEKEDDKAQVPKTGSGTTTGSNPSSSEIKPAVSTLEVVFDEAMGAKVSTALTKKRVVRYQTNPEVNWGPMSRASGH